MAENKTKPSGGSVDAFLDSIEDPGKKEDSRTLVRLMGEITGSHPRMWGDSMVGFGNYHYRYASGREGDWFQVGFSPRKQALTIYIMGYLDQYADLLEGLGSHKTGKGCLYLKKLSDIDMKVLETLIRNSIASLRNQS